MYLPAPSESSDLNKGLEKKQDSLYKIWHHSFLEGIPDSVTYFEVQVRTRRLTRRANVADDLPLRYIFTCGDCDA